MKISIITLFPELLKSALSHSILGRATEKGLVEFNVVDLRNFGIGRHKTVDDKPYGGGNGMILKVDVLTKAIESTINTNDDKVILLCPQGKVYNQELAEKLSKEQHIILVCGHYEGFDERIRDVVDLEISIGDYVLTGGEFPAMVIADSITRLIPGVLKEGSAEKESHGLSKNGRVLEGAQYTRPEDFEGKKVPSVYLAGDPKKIDEYKKESAINKTKFKRPDLLKSTT